MPSLDSPTIVAEGFFQRGIAAVLLVGALATSVPRYFWQLALLRNYLWFVSIAAVLVYTFLFIFYLKGFRGVMSAREFVLVQPLVVLAAWCWLDISFRVVNCGLDRSPPVELAAQVVGWDKRKTAYFLHLSASPKLEHSEMMVPEGVYRRAMKGAGRVVVTLHPGLLGASWCGRNDIRAASDAR